MAAPQFMTGNTPVIRMVPCATAKAVDDGDIVGIAANTMVKASDTAWDTNLATTQTAFALLFVGIAVHTKAAGTARPYGNSQDNLVGVDIGGVTEWEFDAVADTYNVGDYVGPAKQSGNALEDQKVAKVASEALAIGKVTRATAASATRVRFTPLSQLLPLAQQA